MLIFYCIWSPYKRLKSYITGYDERLYLLSEFSAHPDGEGDGDLP